MNTKHKSVLIPHDGSDLSGKVVNAAEVVLPGGVNITLVHVDTTGDDDVGLVDETAAELAARGVEVERADERAPDAAAALSQIIDRRSPDLVLMASHGRSGSGRFIRGSIAERMLRSCSAPLLMLNPSVREPLKLESVLVPLDASENAVEVIPPLLDLIADTNARVTLFFVDFDDPTDTAEIREKRREQRKSDIAGWFKDAADQIAASGCTAELRIEHGNAAEEIVKAAKEDQYDLLALTTHGRSGVARWAFGSVADKVLSTCEKPILLKRIK